MHCKASYIMTKMFTHTLLTVQVLTFDNVLLEHYLFC